jgi:hypothetical protein
MSFNKFSSTQKKADQTGAAKADPVATEKKENPAAVKSADAAENAPGAGAATPKS